MEPRFHTGDLAVVRPADHYSVGEIVAYHSTLLHVLVLHRIVAQKGNTYVFKGDNNNFLDPVRPNRSELLGALWFRVPHGGVLICDAPYAVLCRRTRGVPWRTCALRRSGDAQAP